MAWRTHVCQALALFPQVYWYSIVRIETKCFHVSVRVDEVFGEVREWLQTLVDGFMVEVPHYISQSLIGVFEVLVSEVLFWEVKWKVLRWRWCWVPNRSKHIIIWCCGSFLRLGIICIGMVFHALVWWYSNFRMVFCAVWNASFRVQECWQVSAACIVPLSFVLVECWIRML